MTQNDCAAEGWPTIYTRITEFLQWIEENKLSPSSRGSAGGRAGYRGGRREGRGKVVRRLRRDYFGREKVGFPG